MIKMNSSTQCTVVIIGDSKTGKTSLIQRFTNDTFTEDYTPTGFDKVLALLEVDKHEVQFTLWDTSGSSAYDSVRSLAYHEADVFLVCYKISDPISLYNVKSKWILEIRKLRPDAPVVLCGCQSDLRADSATAAALSRTGRAPVSREQGLAICCEIGAVNFVEASAVTDIRDVQEAFEVCALASLSKCAVQPTSPVERKDSKRSSSSHSSRRIGISNDLFSQKSFKNSTSSEYTNTTSSKKSIGSLSTHSSLCKKNVSFSASDTESICLETSACIQSYNVTESSLTKSPKPDETPKSRVQSPRMESQKIIRSSIVGCPPSRNQDVRSPDLTHDLLQDVGVEDAGKVCVLEDREENFIREFQRPKRLASAIVSPNSNRRSVIDICSPPTSPIMAQVRPSGLSRRASFRSQGSSTPVAVATPKSPLSESSHLRESDLSLPQDTLSPLAVSTRKAVPKLSSHNSLAVFDMKRAAGESLKSHTSTVSHGSTGSKNSTGSSSLDSNTSSARQASRNMPDPDVPDTEDPELLKQLQFVSPKNGVFRPVPSSSSLQSKSGKKRQNCRMM